jgi:hypothetical protein
VEEFYHPDKYKAKFCQNYFSKTSLCEYGKYCCFAHGDHELRIDLIDKYEMDTLFYFFRYKTVWCPYVDTDHDRESCVFAHNWQDFRRKPHKQHYNSEQCPHWPTNKTINEYENGCPNGLKCRRSHGWKERLYHPKYYKTQLCINGLPEQPACTTNHCPYFHELLADKTVLCPYIDDTNHDRETCVFAHRWREFKSKPHKLLYSAK